MATLSETLAALSARGIAVVLHDGRPYVTPKGSALTDDERQLLTANRDELIRVLSHSAEPEEPPQLDRAREPEATKLPDPRTDLHGPEPEPVAPEPTPAPSASPSSPPKAREPEPDPELYAYGVRVRESHVLAMMGNLDDAQLVAYRAGRISKRQAYAATQAWMKQRMEFGAWRE